ncbi:hypothetical protein Ahy_B05g075921 isoform C [Arachis hypogaea]|uniref:WAT1-related protein n=1 Tax=Arachis hypogaea TaxID=3818 RepID=A0A444Z291_ARAHY|nr:hypothetical protein Ahy_B05g075921 isoform C [Arachis hypogaea]
MLLLPQLRMEKIDVKTRTTQAKIVGSIISIGGAFIVTFYKGPSIIIADDSPSLHLVQRLNGNFESVDTNWVIGGFLLTAGNILLTLWFILQVEILKEFPDELSMVCFYNLFAAIFAYAFGLIAETNPSAWKLRLDLSLVSIVCIVRFLLQIQFSPENEKKKKS